MIGGPSTLAPLLIFIFYVISLVILIKGDYCFWICNNLLVVTYLLTHLLTYLLIYSLTYIYLLTHFISYIKAFISLVLILIYCFGVLGIVDSKRYNENVPMFNDSITGFMHSMPVTSWFFIGIEALPFVTDMVNTDSLAHLFNHLLAYLFTYLLAYLLTYLFTYLFTHFHK
jgi:hypothetical protein